MEYVWPKHRNVEKHQQSSERMHNRYKHISVPQYQSPSHSNHSSRHKPPILLRLDSQGESIEEFPSCSVNFHERVPQQQRNQGQHQPRTHSFIGNIFRKASHSFYADRTTQHFANNCNRSLQGEINLDVLADKFTNSLRVEPTDKMLDQDMSSRHHLAQRQMPHALPRMMNFNGGPYITCSSQNNSLRTFPACYRFLNLAHFHPYASANRCDQARGMHQPFGQVKSSWGVIPSTNVPMMQSSGMNAGPRPRMYCLNAHHGNKPRADMMQTNHRMSHSQHIITNGNKLASSQQLHIKTKSLSATGQIKTPPRNEHFFHDGSTDGSSQTATCTLQRDVSKQSQQLCTASNRTPVIPNAMPLPKKQYGSDRTSSEQFILDAAPAKPTTATEIKDFSEDTDSVNKQNLHVEKCNNNDTKTNEDNENHKHLLDQSASNSASVSTSEKEMHSSIAYLLGNYSAESSSGSNDSDFSDADEDTLNEEIDRDNQELLESFLTNDVYNPLDGWKCLRKSTVDKGENDTIAEVDNAAFNDSGVSEPLADAMLQDIDANDADSDTSDDWSDSGCDDEAWDEEEQRIWDSMNHCDDPYDPIQGWRCNQPRFADSRQQMVAENTTDSLQQTVVDSTLDSRPQTVADNTIDSGEQTVGYASTESNQMVSHDSTESTQESTDSVHESDAHTLQVEEPSAFKPDPVLPSESTQASSVSFILGGDDYDSSSDSDTDYDETSQLQDELWNSFEISNDPYDPINGWRCQSVSPLHKSTSSPSLLCTQHTSDATGPVSDSSDHEETTSTTAGILLKSSSSTGCLMLWRRTTSTKVGEKKPKKVTFCDKGPTIFSQEVPMWAEEEYTQARRGQWQDFARDRCRFQRRIRESELSLAPCFSHAHRMKVFQKLYSNQGQ